MINAEMGKRNGELIFHEFMRLQRQNEEKKYFLVQILLYLDFF